MHPEESEQATTRGSDIAELDKTKEAYSPETRVLRKKHGRVLLPPCPEGKKELQFIRGLQANTRGSVSKISIRQKRVIFARRQGL